MFILSTLVALLFLTGFYLLYHSKYRFSIPVKLIMGATTVGLCSVFWFFNHDTQHPTLPIEISLIGIFVYLMGTDLIKMELPDGGNLVILCLGILHGLISNTLLLNLATAIGLFLLFLLVAWTGGLGGGDIKYVGAFGLFMQPHQVLLFLWIAFFTALIFGLILIFGLKKGTDKKEPFPFGPFLILASFYILFLY